ncbi:MAG: hypothetical protein V7739_04905 [Motiliproteus sp.]
MKTLEDYGCDIVLQGFLIAKPLKEEGFEQWRQNYQNGEHSQQQEISSGNSQGSVATDIG